LYGTMGDDAALGSRCGEIDEDDSF
jgi:hypothetical protein